MKSFASLLALAFLLGTAPHVFAQQSISGSGGTLTAPTRIGQNITVTGVNLSGGGTASLTCPVTFFGFSTYQWNWQCAGGTLTEDGHAAASVSGSMKLTCSGGGKDHPTTCWHVFTGTAASNGSTGALSVQAKGGANNAPGTVVLFSAAW